MNVRHLLIATAIVAAWTAGARFVAVRAGTEPLSEFGFDDWAAAYAIALLCAIGVSIGVAVVVGLTSLIDYLFFADKPDLGEEETDD